MPTGTQLANRAAQRNKAANALKRADAVLKGKDTTLFLSGPTDAKTPSAAASRYMRKYGLQNKQNDEGYYTDGNLWVETKPNTGYMDSFGLEKIKQDSQGNWNVPVPTLSLPNQVATGFEANGKPFTNDVGYYGQKYNGQDVYSDAQGNDYLFQNGSYNPLVGLPNVTPDFMNLSKQDFEGKYGKGSHTSTAKNLMPGYVPAKPPKKGNYNPPKGNTTVTNAIVSNGGMSSQNPVQSQNMYQLQSPLPSATYIPPVTGTENMSYDNMSRTTPQHMREQANTAGWNAFMDTRVRPLSNAVAYTANPLLAATYDLSRNISLPQASYNNPNTNYSTAYGVSQNSNPMDYMNYNYLQR